MEYVERLVYGFSKVKRITPAYSFIIGVPAEAPEEYKSTLKLTVYRKNIILMLSSSARNISGFILAENCKEEAVRKYHYAEPASFEEGALRHSPDNDLAWF